MYLLTVGCFTRDSDDYGKNCKQPAICHHTVRKQLTSTNLTNGQDTYLRSSDFTHIFQKLIFFRYTAIHPLDDH